VLSAALVAAATAVSQATAVAADFDQRLCSNSTRQVPCSVRLNDGSLEVRLGPDQVLKTRRLGRWRISHQDGITTRSCNARIDLGDEIVYGILQISSTTGTSLIWPQKRIDIPDLHFSATSP